MSKNKKKKWRFTNPKFIYLKIRRRDGVQSLTTLEEGYFKAPIDGYISLIDLRSWNSSSYESRMLVNDASINAHVVCASEKVCILFDDR